MSASSQWPEWLAAIGTVSAVVVALGIQGIIWIRENRRRPALELAFDREHSHVERNPLSQLVPYVRLRVANASGKDAAQNVQVLVREFAELDAAGSATRIIRLGSPPLGWTHGRDDATRLTVAPGIARFVDLGFCFVEGVDDLRLRLVVHPQPYERRNELGGGDYRISLALVADNCDATFWDLLLRLPARWRDETAFWQEFRASVVPSQSETT